MGNDSLSTRGKIMKKRATISLEKLVFLVFLPQMYQFVKLQANGKGNSFILVYILCSMNVLSEEDHNPVFCKWLKRFYFSQQTLHGGSVL